MGLKQIVGYEKEVKRLTAILDFINSPEKYRAFDTTLPKSLLLYGEIDTGKKFMAKALLDDCQRKVFTLPDSCNSWKKLNKFFKKVKKSSPSIVYVGELDGYSEGLFSALNDQMSEVDGDQVFLVATFDVTEERPLGYLGALRFDYSLNIPDPSFDDNCKIIKSLIADKKLSADFNVEDLCYFAQNRTAAKFEKAYNIAATIAVYDGSEYITNDHFVKAFYELDNTPVTAEFVEQVAYHECGHAAVNMLLGGIPAYITLFDNDEGVFFAKRSVDKTIDDKKRRYMTSLGGKASEEVFYNSCSTGSYGDLNKAAKSIESDLSELASLGFEYYDATQCSSYGYNDALAQKVQQELNRFYDQAKSLIEQNRPLVVALVEKLKEKHYLLHTEIVQIYTDYLNSK